MREPSTSRLPPASTRTLPDTSDRISLQLPPAGTMTWSNVPVIGAMHSVLVVLLPCALSCASSARVLPAPSRGEVTSTQAVRRTVNEAVRYRAGIRSMDDLLAWDGHEELRVRAGSEAVPPWNP